MHQFSVTLIEGIGEITRIEGIVRHVIKDLLDTYHPDNFIEVFSGGGTGEDVAAEYGYKDSIHLDLNNGWDALKDDLPRSSDFIFSHPPYWSIIDYNKVRGEYTDTIFPAIQVMKNLFLSLIK